MRLRLWRGIDGKKNSKKLNKLYYLVFIALILLLIVLSIYFWNFHNSFSANKVEWGIFGDFVGGTLNPLFALLSLFAILYTIKIQTQELEYTREELQATKEELAKSRIAQEEQSEAFKIQNQSIAQQTFENTFYKLLEFLETCRRDIKDDSGHIGKYAIEFFFNTFKDVYLRTNQGSEYNPIHVFDETCKCLEGVKNEYEVFYKVYGNELGQYFKVLYNILKFIDTNESVTNKNIYANLLRAQLSRYELSLLFYNCLSDFGEEKMAPLIKKYHILKHLEECYLPNEHQYLWNEFNNKNENKLN